MTGRLLIRRDLEKGMQLAFMEPDTLKEQWFGLIYMAQKGPKSWLEQEINISEHYIQLIQLDTKRK